MLATSTAHADQGDGGKPQPANERLDLPVGFHPPGGVDPGLSVDGARRPAAPVAIFRSHARSPVHALRSLASRVNSVLVLVNTRV